MLAVSVLLGVLPLLGIALIFYQDPAITVDNLFLSLMLLTISGIFLLNAAAELRPRFRRKKREAKAVAAAAVGVPMAGGLARRRGLVRDVQFFEAPVGVPNKSIVTLQLNGANSARILAFEGDLRNALPLGKKVEISFRENAGVYDLQEVNYL